MIIDKISNAVHYTSLIKNIDKAVEFINKNYNLPQGRHEFAGGAVISSVITSASVQEKDFEAHQRFADVMFVIQGEETVSFCPISELEIKTPYDTTADIAFYEGENKDILFTVPEGYFYAALPGEGHKPCVHIQNSKSTKKYVIKCSQI